MLRFCPCNAEAASSQSIKEGQSNQDKPSEEFLKGEQLLGIDIVRTNRLLYSPSCIQEEGA